MTDDKKSFFVSLPGILTGLTAVITAVSGLYALLKPKLPNPVPSSQNIQKHISHPEPIPFPQPQQSIFKEKAIINDPDGYTNIPVYNGFC